MGAITGLPVIGFAKPVPVDPRQLRNPRRDMVFVSLAGPFTNFLLMAGAALITRALLRGDGFLGAGIGSEGPDLVIQIVFAFAVVNLFLGLFNLLPIPPLDGSALIERVLPGRWLPGWHRFRPYGILVLFVLVLSTNVVSRILAPFYDALRDFVVT
jgi:Zn-dependent protease